MAVLALPIVGLLALSIAARPAGAVVAGVEDVVYDEEVMVLRSVEIAYPRLAAAARIHGVVVVRVTLHDGGEVRSVEPVSGPKVLVEASVTNAPGWAVRPTRSKTAILVYDFQLDPGLCGKDASFYTVRAPNVSVIKACREALNP